MNRRLRTLALILVFALVFGFGIALIGQLFPLGLGLIVAGMFGFLLGGVALIYLERAR